MIVFDIETGPLPEKQLREIAPAFDPGSVKHPGEFDPASVKCGNIGGPESEKGKAKIAAARAEHEEAVARYESDLEKAESAYWYGIINQAALKALTGQVLAIGYQGKGLLIESQDTLDEAELLARFWSCYNRCAAGKRPMVGFNSREFDVPFIVQRSYLLAVDVPSSVFDQGRWLSRTFVDLRDLWSVGSRNASGTLDQICRACGIGQKTEGITGADFSRLFADLETRPKALEYLANDIAMTHALAMRLGVN